MRNCTIAALLFVCGCGSKKDDFSGPKLTPSSLSKSANQDPERARRDYDGKIIESTGSVESVEWANGGKCWIVTLASLSGEKGKVYCWLDSEKYGKENETLKKVRAGDRATIRGAGKIRDIWGEGRIQGHYPELEKAYLVD